MLHEPGRVAGQTVLALSILFFLALTLRVAMVQSRDIPPENDELQYHEFALKLMEKDNREGHSLGKTHAFRPPLYPAFIATIYAIAGRDYRTVWYVQAVLNAALVFLIYLLGVGLFSQSVGLVAAGLFAFHPSFELVPALMRENVMVLLFFVFLYSMVEGIKRSHTYAFAVAGCCLGLLALTNVVYGLLPLMILLVGLIDRRFRARWSHLLLVAILGLCIWLPWHFWYSQDTEGSRRFQEFQNNNLVFANYPIFAGTFWWPLEDMRELELERENAKRFFQQRKEAHRAYELDEQLDEVRRDLRTKIAERPFAYVAFVVNRCLILLVSPPAGSSMLGQIDPFFRALAFWANIVFVFGAILCLVLHYRLHISGFPFVGALVYILAVFGNLHSLRRYGFVLQPVWCLFGAAAFSYVWNRVVRIRDQAEDSSAT